MSQERLGEIERLLRVAEDELSYVQHQRQFLLDQIASLKREREGLLHSTIADRSTGYPAAPISNQSGEKAKIALFRSLFRGREDVYARRFESRRRGYRQLGYEICGEPPRLRIDAVASGSIPKREGDDRRASQGDDEKES